MIKNVYLSLKKNKDRTILLFVIMVILVNLIIAGLSIKEATQKSMQSIRSSLGNDVTLSVNIKNMMDHREKGQSMEMSETSITTQMADQLIGLEDVVSYNYTIS